MSNLGLAPVAAAILQGRAEVAFPELTPGQMAVIERFGSVQRFADRELLFEPGKPRIGMLVVRTGRLSVVARDGFGREIEMVVLGPGHFSGEVATLIDDASPISWGYAVGALEAIVVPSERIRALLVEDAGLGEIIMRALVLRRFALVELGEGGPLLIDPGASPARLRLEEFLRRNGHPHRHVDPAADATAAEVLARERPAPDELPLVVLPGGEVLRNPSEAVLAAALGLLAHRLAKSTYDVAIVGCGPAGLATAVYAASEGLATVVFDRHAFGGQAGASARIENYLGFPSGVSGLELTARAYAQARKFGADIAIPVEVTTLDCSRRNGLLSLVTGDGREVHARTLVIASGASYRRLALENLASFEGRGVWYWASTIEAKLCKGTEVVVVGGGNSAGQAAVFLAEQVAKVRMMVRGPGLVATMSSYLVQRIEATPNIELMTDTEIVALEGGEDGALAGVRWRSRRDGKEASAPLRNVFLFLGATPATRWLAACGVRLDAGDFVMTGGPGAAPLESSVPGVFAVGDVRSGSVKRVGSAIGEGAEVVAAVHRFLAEHQ